MGETFIVSVSKVNGLTKSCNPARRTKKKDIYVISTVTRPVPLEHYLYAGRNMFKIVDAKGRLLDQGYITYIL